MCESLLRGEKLVPQRFGGTKLEEGWFQRGEWELPAALAPAHRSSCTVPRGTEPSEDLMREFWSESLELRVPAEFRVSLARWFTASSSSFRDELFSQNFAHAYHSAIALLRLPFFCFFFSSSLCVPLTQRPCPSFPSSITEFRIQS